MADMSSQTIDEIDVAAILDTYVYMDTQSENFNNKTLREVLDEMPSKVKKSEDYKAVLNAIEQNPSLGDYEIISQSMCDGYDEKLVIACTFKDPETGNIYVSYRGTGDGKWVDNGEGLTAKSTIMQDTSVAYFDNMMSELSEDERENSKIIVSGHSKGGNEAQYVTLTSDYRDKIAACYSIDGQGFSKEAIEYFKKTLGDDYEAYLRKMYSINGENDYVHDLGEVIIPEDHTYIIPTPNASGFSGFHDIKEMLAGAGLNWLRDEDGRVLHGEQGFLGLYAKSLSENMMEMSEEDLDDCAVTIMFLLEAFLPYDDVTGGQYKFGTGNRKCPSVKEMINCFSLLIPTLWDSLKDTIVDIAKVKIEEIVDSVKSWVADKINKAITWYNNNFNAGYKYATANPNIEVNTAKLRSYASRLSSINTRIVNLDRRLDSLYYKVGFLDLWNLMQADLLTGYSLRLRLCINYLEDTAEEFETVERSILSQL